ncbi:MAG: PilN domain-containing protein [Myxococcota bacterium]|nr:PilN domain-containing protein [Myxococcota bacterium]
MIEVNLLPHREARRLAEVRRLGLILAASIGLALVGVGFVHSNMARQSELATASVRQLEADLDRFKPQQEKVAEFKLKKRALEEKLDAIRALELARQGPLRLLGEIGKQTPDRLWLTQLNASGGEVVLGGASLDTSVVADFLRNLNDSSYFTEVDLNRTAREREFRGVKLVNFTIKVRFVEAPEAAMEGGV